VIDLKRLRDEPEYRRGVERKRVRAGLIDEVLQAYDAETGVRHATEAQRAEQNKASKEIGKAAPDERQAKIERAAAMKAELQANEEVLAAAEAQLRALALQVPNPAAADAPDGGEDDGVALRTVGEENAPPPLDMRRSRRRWASSRRRAQRRRAAPGLPTSCARPRCWSSRWSTTRCAASWGTASRRSSRPRSCVSALWKKPALPTDRAQVYDVDDGELFLVGTSEVPLSALHRAEAFAPDALPVRYAGYSSVFVAKPVRTARTRGDLPVHQFDKVEMFSYCAPDDSLDEHERILAIEEEIIGGLGCRTAS